MITQVELRNPVLVPQKTDTYVPVPNGDFIDAVMEEADKRNFHLESEKWGTARNNNLMQGTLVYTGTDTTMGMQVGLLNSYDKTKPATIAIGGNVFICSNGVVSADFTLKRKHTGTVWKDLNELIGMGMERLEEEYHKILETREHFSQIEFNKRQQSEMLGRLFVEEEILTPTIANVVRKQIIEPEHLDFVPENVWSFYNHCTQGLKQSHPSQYIQKHVELHNFMVHNFN